MFGKHTVVCYVKYINGVLCRCMFHDLILVHNNCELNLPYVVQGVKRRETGFWGVDSVGNGKM